ncbi:MAG: NAD-dependent epimerase/dehydratase family protein [Candidatus Dormibacteraceae bacterium]
MARGRALVTGGAGLIGSHLVDQLVDHGWTVRILDSLEPQTHGAGRPTWINPAAEFRLGDVRCEPDLCAALQDVDVVFHLAAYGGYMPEIARYLETNSLGTARLFEEIRRIRGKSRLRKVVIASSQAVYEEGCVTCPTHGLQFPPRRTTEAMSEGRFEIPCPVCGGPAAAAPTPETAPAAAGTVYGLTKVDQERLGLIMGVQLGLPVVALRYACTYGPRQSLFNPYTGVITIFCTRLLNGLAPVLYEDGRQTRDLCFVEDTARATRFAAETEALDGRAVNVGSGRATAISDLARLLADRLGVPGLVPELAGEFRPGEMRALTADVTAIAAAGFEPRVPLEEGIDRHLRWLRRAGRLEERFSGARGRLARQGIVQAIGAPAGAR